MTVHGLDEVLSFRPLGPEDADIAVFQVLDRAVRERRTLKFLYRNLGSERTQNRHVRPYHLACIDNHWHLLGYDLNRQAIRAFALTRLRRPRITRQGFARPADFEPGEYLRRSFSVYKGREDYEVVMDFDPWAADLIRGRRWHASQELTDLPKGWARLRLDSIEEMERRALGWGAHATVVRPKALAERLLKTARVLAERYRDKAGNEQ